jgi:hypothetical protein
MPPAVDVSAESVLELSSPPEQANSAAWVRTRNAKSFGQEVFSMTFRTWELAAVALNRHAK